MTGRRSAGGGFCTPCHKTCYRRLRTRFLRVRRSCAVILDRGISAPTRTPIFVSPTVLGVWILLGLSAHAGDLRSDQFMTQAQVGFGQIYNMDYEPAIKTFTALKARYEDHPGPPMYLASAIWLRELFRRKEFELDKFVAPAYFTESRQEAMPGQDRQAFLDFIEESNGISAAILEEDPKNKDARYYQGTCYGILGAFSITIDGSKSGAFKHGRRAYRFHKELLKDDPEYFDSYLTVGLYEYVVGNLPWYIKWLAIIAGYSGTEEQGFEYLQIAAQKSTYNADQAKAVQMVLYVREKDYENAFQTARYLHGKYPRSFVWLLNQAQILENMGEKERAASAYVRVVERAEAEEPNYDAINLATFRFTVAQKLMDLHQLEPALQVFRRCIESMETPERQRVFSHLRTGQILDVQGKRESAIAHYKEVLSHTGFKKARQAAEDFLKRPYAASAG